MTGLNLRENSAFYVCLILAVLATAGCSSTKYLEEGQTFLESNSTRIKSKEKIKNKPSLKAGLEEQYRQAKTRVFLGIPRHTFYYAGANNPKDRWFKRWLHTKLGDAPVIFDTTLVEQTRLSMEAYLEQHGYWNNTVTPSIRTEGHRTTVTYDANPGKRWTIRNAEFATEDTTIQAILDSIFPETLLEPGAPVDIELIEREKLRITRVLQNIGYANFYQNYISAPEADSSKYEMDLFIDVLDPADDIRHQVYTIGEIRVYPDFTSDQTVSVDTVINGIRFLSPGLPMLVNPETILRQIYFESGETYARDRHEKTVRQLNKIETYSFVSARPSISPEDSTVLDFDIFLNRNKKQGIGGDIEFNYSTLSASRRNLIGLGANLNYRNRNLFGGGEFFTANIETGIEFNLQNPDTLVNTLNIGFLNSLWVPKFVDPFHFYRGLNKLKIRVAGP